MIRLRCSLLQHCCCSSEARHPRRTWPRRRLRLSRADAATTAAPTPLRSRSGGEARRCHDDIETALINSANDYRIGPEDLLDISVWKNPELSRTVPVRPDGKVSLPLVNDIQAPA